MRSHTTPRTLVAVACAALGLGLVATMAPSAVAAGPSGFTPVTTYAPQLDVPGPISCVGPRFCMELAYGADVEGLGSAPGVLTTLDGGARWRYTEAPTLARTYPETSALTCVSATTCLVETDGRVDRTRDGGATWTAIGGTPTRSSVELLACAAPGTCLTARARHGSLALAILTPTASGFRPVRAVGVPHGFSPDALACPAWFRCVLEGTLHGDLATLVAAGPRATMRFGLARRLPRQRVVALSCVSAMRCDAVEVLSAGRHHRDVEFVRSTDGGVNWRGGARLPAGSDALVAPTAPTSGGDALSCSSARTCVVVVDGPTIHALVTHDGGAVFHDRAFAAYRGSSRLAAAGSCLANGRCVVDGVSAAGASGPGGGIDMESSGRAWRAVPIPSSPALATSLLCTVASTCYRVDRLVDVHGYGAVLEVSTDGGARWRGVRLPRGIEPFVVGGCQTAVSCEVIGVHGIRLVRGELGNYDFRGASIVELVTANGGASWQQRRVAAPYEDPLGASCTSATACVILAGRVNTFPWSEDSALVATVNGTRWHVQPLGRHAPQSGPDWLLVRSFLAPWALSCAPGGTCLFAQGPRQAPLSSTDGGVRWEHAALPVARAVIGGVACTGGTACAAAYARKGAVGFAQTTNGGRSWSTSPLPLADRSLGGGVYAGGVPLLACSSAGDCTAVMPEYFTAVAAATTVDGGTSWTPLAWHGTVPAVPAAGETAAGLLSCSATACLVEAKGAGDDHLAYQLERAALP